MATLFKRSNGIYYQITSIGTHQVWRSTGVRSLVEAKKVVASNFQHKKLCRYEGMGTG